MENELQTLRDKFFKECTQIMPDLAGVERPRVVMAPHDLFEWIKRNVITKEVKLEPQYEKCCNNPFILTAPNDEHFCQNCLKQVDVKILEGINREEAWHKLYELLTEFKSGAVNIDKAIEQIGLYQKKILTEIDFGNYVYIEQHRFGGENEFYKYKVIGRGSSNSYVDVPRTANEKERIHDSIEDVIYCVCCGVSETEVLKFRIEDVISPTSPA